ncbi:MAG: HNH endonuclease signature motif containing protein, partial [Acidimicrobiia bacterium]
MARLFASGADDQTMQAADERDISGIDKLGALSRRIRRRDERQAHEERHVRCSLSLDESVGFIHAQLGAYDYQVVSRALDERVDQFPTETRLWSREQRRADALVGIAQDSLNRTPGEGGVSGPVVTVLVEASTAAESGGEAGVAISGGPRVGPDTLDRILCEGSVEVMIDQGSGRAPVVSATTGVIPPKIRRFVLLRDGGCTIDGCGSRYRLEVHHIVPRSQGGTHDVENLTTLCWWHHHVAIHGRGYRIDPTSPPQRRRIIPEEHDPTKNPP